MPHYSDGTLAQVGDWVVGKTYNRKGLVAGILAAVTDVGDACNCIVAFPKILDFPVSQGTFSGAILKGLDGIERFVELDWDYGEIRAFRKVG